MYRDKKIGLVIPCRNEERLLPRTLETVPQSVDRVYVVDDLSDDGTVEAARRVAASDPRIEVILHDRNRGPGAAIVSGYRRAVEEKCDLIAVVGGDDQMDLAELPAFLDPLVENRADYAKGNRFLSPEETWRCMPRIRLLANILITALTKIASGYYKISDVVDGYTAITREAIQRVRWKGAWEGYGYPMDFLVRINAAGLRVIDVPRRPIYTPGERQSQIRSVSYALRVAPMLLRDFLWRLGYKYVIRDFHPLVLFYLMGLVLLPLGLLFGTWLIHLQYIGTGVSGPRAILCALMIMMGFQSLIFAMLFDMQAGKDR